MHIPQPRVALRLHDSVHIGNADVSTISLRNPLVNEAQRHGHVDRADADPEDVHPWRDPGAGDLGKFGHLGAVVAVYHPLINSRIQP